MPPGVQGIMHRNGHNFDKPTGRGADHAFEMVGEVTLVRKPGEQGRIGNTASIEQQLFRLRYAGMGEILMGGDTNVPGEEALEVKRAEAGHRSQRGQTD